MQKSTYKWNVAHLGGDIGDKLRETWASLSKDASFLFKFHNITRYYTQYSKLKVQENRKIEFDVKAKLEVATANLHNDIYNVDLQGEVSRYKSILDEVEVRKTRGVMVRLKVKWQRVGNKCKVSKTKNSQAVISKLKDNKGRIFIRRKDLEKIRLEFYKNLYQYKEVAEPALREVLDDIPVTFRKSMNWAISQEITDKELASAFHAMATGKVPGYDGLPIEFFQLSWTTVGPDLFLMLPKRIEYGLLHKGVTKELISLIPKEVTSKTSITGGQLLSYGGL